MVNEVGSGLVYGLFYEMGGPLEVLREGVLMLRALLFGVHMRAPDFWKLTPPIERQHHP